MARKPAGGDTESRVVPGTGLLHKFFVLLEFVASRRSASIQDLSRRTGWPRATLYRIVGTATDRGYLRFDPISSRYTLGFRFVELAQNVWSSGDLVTIAALELRRLRDITGETAHLGVLQDIHVVAMGKYDSPHPYREAARLGLHKSLHSTSQGKAVLAFLPEIERDQIIARMDLRPSTPHTITDPDILRSQLRIIRQRGYSVDDEEAALGTRCVGAPILNSAGRPIAAISIAGPTYRVTTDRVERLGPEIAQVAHHIGSLVREGTDMPAEPERGPAVLAVSDVPALDGVSPSWDGAGRTVHWGDRLAPRVHSTAGPTRSFRFSSDMPINVVAHAAGRLAAYGGGWLLSITAEGRIEERRTEGLRHLSALGVGPTGVPFGAVLDEAQGLSIIGPLTPEGTVADRWQVLGDVSDLSWSGDGVLYAAVPRRGLVYTLTEGAAPRILARISKASGEPRGLAVDMEGRLWVSLYDGWSVARLTVDGEIERVIALPVPRPTGLAFGDDASGGIYVTTARIDLPRDVLENAPLSGRLLLAETGVGGFVPPPMRYVPGFAG